MKARRWAPIVFGVAVFVVFCAISAAVFGVSWMREHLQVEAASDSSAEAAFTEVRQRFAAKAPLHEMRDSPSMSRLEPGRRKRTRTFEPAGSGLMVRIATPPLLKLRVRAAAMVLPNL